MLIPALDLIDGRIVRLQQGDFDRKTVFDADPISKIREYESDGAALIHIVDLDGAKDPKNRQLDVIGEMVKAVKCPVQTGGGVRTMEDVRNLLDAGVHRVVAGSAAIRDPDFGIRLLENFGGDRVCIAPDVRIIDGVPKVATHGWLKTEDVSVYELLDIFMRHGLRHALITDISKDGMMQGANTKLYGELARRYPGLDVIASGGISSLDDIRAVRESGAGSCVLGRALLAGAFTFKEAVACWPNA